MSNLLLHSSLCFPRRNNGYIQRGQWVVVIPVGGWVHFIPSDDYFPGSDYASFVRQLQCKPAIRIHRATRIWFRHCDPSAMMTGAKDLPTAHYDDYSVVFVGP
jgi:hypothetical protein